MAIIAGLRTYLLAQTSVTAIVGAAGVYPQSAPQQAALPLILLTRMDEDPNECLDAGPATATFRTEIDIDCKASTALAAADLSTTVRAALRNYTGAMGAHTCQAIEMTGRSDGEDAPQAGTDNPTYMTTLELNLFYQ